MRNVWKLVRHMSLHTRERGYNSNNFSSLLYQLCKTKVNTQENFKRKITCRSGVCKKCGKFQAVVERHQKSCGIDLEARRFCQKCRILFPFLAEKLKHDAVNHKKLATTQLKFTPVIFVLSSSYSKAFSKGIMADILRKEF